MLDQNVSSIKLHSANILIKLPRTDNFFGRDVDDITIYSPPNMSEIIINDIQDNVIEIELVFRVGENGERTFSNFILYSGSFLAVKMVSSSFEIRV